MWSQRVLLTSAIAIAVLLIVPQTAAECGKCNGNLACINETAFALCVNGVITTQEASCKAPTPYCVGGSTACAADLPADCTIDDSKCGVCERWSEGNLFTCTSKHTYAICNENGEIVEGSQKECPNGRVCTTTDAYVCMPQCSLLHEPECPLPSPRA